MSLRRSEATVAISQRQRNPKQAPTQTEIFRLRSAALKMTGNPVIQTKTK